MKVTTVAVDYLDTNVSQVALERAPGVRYLLVAYFSHVLIWRSVDPKLKGHFLCELSEGGKYCIVFIIKNCSFIYCYVSAKYVPFRFFYFITTNVLFLYK